FLDAPVRRAVDLDDVHERPGLALTAHRASPARLGARPLGTEERPRQEPRRRGLADAARAREEVGVGDARGGERIPERARDRVLADDRVERLGPPLPGQDLIAHRLTPRAEPPVPLTRHPRCNPASPTDAARRRGPPPPGPGLIAPRRSAGAAPPVPLTRHPRFNPASRSNTMTVHPPSNEQSCDLPTTPAPVRYSHGTREGRLTVAPFRAWRGSAILVAWGPTFSAAP